MAALALYQEKRQALEWLRLEEWLYACPPRTRIKVSRPATTADVIRISTETRHIDVALAGVAAHLYTHKARLGLFPVPGTDDEFVKTANPDPHVLL